MMQCIAEGHDVVALANLRPKDKGKVYTSHSIVSDMWYGDFSVQTDICRVLLRKFDFLYSIFQTNWTVTCFRR